MTENGQHYEASALREELKGATAMLEGTRERLREMNTKFVSLQLEVRNAFHELVDDGDLEIAKANEVLEALGIELLATEWEFEATVVVRGYGKSAKAEDLESAVEQASFSIEVGYEPGVDDVEINDVEVTAVSVDGVVQ